MPCRIFFAAALLLLLPGTLNAQNAKPGETMLILDASGSMWGQVEGVTKISAARNAVDAILSKWRKEDALGLMAYGHREKGDCKDIETLVPVGVFDPLKIKRAVAGLNPRGKTPIAGALRAASDGLKATENKATVILVSDGIETCEPDPCAVAAELKKNGIDFRAHVIGFDVADPAAKAQLQCIARASGGVYLDAGNASTLQDALGKAVAAAQGMSVKSETPTKPSEDPYKGKNIQGVVRLAPGLDPITDSNSDVHWTLYPVARDDERGNPLEHFYGSPFSGNYPAGAYAMEVQYGNAIANVESFEIKQGERAKLDVVLDAAYVTSEAFITNAGKDDKVTWELHNKTSKDTTTVYDAVPKFIVKANNDYSLKLIKGSAHVSKDFSPQAGDTLNIPLTLDVGKLAVSAVYAAGGPKVDKGITVEVNQPAKSEIEKGEWVGTLYDETSQFDLPSGSYEVVVSVGAAKKKVMAEVKSGALNRLVVPLDAGVVGIKAPGLTAVEIFEAARDINNERQNVFTGYDEQTNLSLNAGDYAVVVSFANDKKVEKAITVTAGKRLDVEIKNE